MLVAELAGKTFQAVEEDLIDLLTLPEAPVWAIGNYRGLVSRKDALFTAGVALNQDDIDRFFEVAEFILSEDDPALDLPPEERWSANIYGKKRCGKRTACPACCLWRSCSRIAGKPGRHPGRCPCRQNAQCSRGAQMALATVGLAASR